MIAASEEVNNENGQAGEGLNQIDENEGVEQSTEGQEQAESGGFTGGSNGAVTNLIGDSSTDSFPEPITDFAFDEADDELCRNIFTAT